MLANHSRYNRPTETDAENLNLAVAQAQLNSSAPSLEYNLSICFPWDMKHLAGQFATGRSAIGTTQFVQLSHVNIRPSS